jgi:hypothetical protein
MARRKMSETDLAALIDTRISDCGSIKSDESVVRTNALLFYDGGCDLELQPNRSSVVSCDVADVVDWTQAGLLRVFAAGDKVVIFIPNSPEHEVMAKEATDCINYIWRHEMDGYRLIKDSSHDGLLFGNGIIKVWWEGTPEYSTEWLRGLTEEELDAVTAEPDIDEILELETYEVGPDGEPLKVDEDEDKSDADEGSVDDAY